ncbi:hypothetical protein SAMN04487914_101423 [Arthrobacter sp. ok909]|uniref:hypothetical protein n=1 Tax=Arthrobacter sp. ok909 TaxID=1761746 RepID=UPI000886AB06|nr:hypothetical protein [Arthrobacter sp. ok909]SDO97877.1 hypothetical protein SAMN04487914_101423 [Arthrobacter sp. ok909]
MIVYRPIPPLTAGGTGLKSALVAMALTAVLGATWQVPGVGDTGEPAEGLSRRSSS